MPTILRSEVIQAREAISPPARPWERTGSIDVEALAQWAYGEQMVDRFERTGLHAIEAAAAGFEVSMGSGDGVYQLMQIEHMGCRIDRGGVLVRDCVHPAALALASVLAVVTDGDLVRYHARAGTRPRGWKARTVKASAAAWVEPFEVAEIEYVGPGRKGAHCRVVFHSDDQSQRAGMAAWRRWWMALQELAFQLSTRAPGFLVTGPSAPPEPWLEAEGAPPNGSSQPTQM